MYRTRPSKPTMELLKSGLVGETQERQLTEVEQAAEKILLAVLSKPDWRLQVEDPHMTINDYAKQELQEGLGIDDKLWDEGVIILLRDKLWLLERTSDRKLHHRPNILKVNLHYPVQGQAPSYLTKQVMEAALRNSE
jgi:hypothetical protein